MRFSKAIMRRIPDQSTEPLGKGPFSIADARGRKAA
jgi:hypothetical protein